MGLEREKKIMYWFGEICKYRAFGSQNRKLKNTEYEGVG